ncbi:MAG: putative nuclease of putative toxin-antitoxin system [Candidatus Nanohaloarchaea archaeon]|jgi:predicted nuclease of predicted toxin-antitoxin system
MKFLIDADLPNSAVEPFQEHGLEAVHVREIGLGSSTDTEISDHANQQDFIVVTRDRDFGNPLLPTKVDQGAVILKLHNYSPKELKLRISYFLEKIEFEELEKSLVIVEESRYRISEY